MDFLHLLQLQAVGVTEDRHLVGSFFKIAASISIINEVEIIYKELGEANNIASLRNPVHPLVLHCLKVSLLCLLALLLELALLLIEIDCGHHIGVTVFVIILHLGPCLLHLFKFFSFGR